MTSLITPPAIFEPCGKRTGHEVTERTPEAGVEADLGRQDRLGLGCDGLTDPVQALRRRDAECLYVIGRHELHN